MANNLGGGRRVTVNIYDEEGILLDSNYSDGVQTTTYFKNHPPKLTLQATSDNNEWRGNDWIEVEFPLWNEQYFIDEMDDDNGVKTAVINLGEVAWSKNPFEIRFLFNGDTNSSSGDLKEYAHFNVIPKRYNISKTKQVIEGKLRQTLRKRAIDPDTCEGLNSLITKLESHKREYKLIRLDQNTPIVNLPFGNESPEGNPTITDGIFNINYNSSNEDFAQAYIGDGWDNTPKWTLECDFMQNSWDSKLMIFLGDNKTIFDYSEDTILGIASSGDENIRLEGYSSNNYYYNRVDNIDYNPNEWVHLKIEKINKTDITIYLNDTEIGTYSWNQLTEHDKCFIGGASWGNSDGLLAPSGVKIKNIKIHYTPYISDPATDNTKIDLYNTSTIRLFGSSEGTRTYNSTDDCYIFVANSSFANDDWTIMFPMLDTYGVDDYTIEADIHSEHIAYNRVGFGFVDMEEGELCFATMGHDTWSSSWRWYNGTLGDIAVDNEYPESFTTKWYHTKITVQNHLYKCLLYDGDSLIAECGGIEPLNVSSRVAGVVIGCPSISTVKVKNIHIRPNKHKLLFLDKATRYNMNDDYTDSNNSINVAEAIGPSEECLSDTSSEYCSQRWTVFNQNQGSKTNYSLTITGEGGWVYMNDTDEIIILTATLRSNVSAYYRKNEESYVQMSMNNPITVRLEYDDTFTVTGSGSNIRIDYDVTVCGKPTNIGTKISCNRSSDSYRKANVLLKGDFKVDVDMLEVNKYGGFYLLAEDNSMKYYWEISTPSTATFNKNNTNYNYSISNTTGHLTIRRHGNKLSFEFDDQIQTYDMTYTGNLYFAHKTHSDNGRYFVYKDLKITQLED